MYWNFNDIIVTQNNDLPVKWDFPRVFVEIGFGNGEFTEYLASAYPDVLIVGIEVSQWCAAKCARRILAAGLKNVRIFHGDARFILRHCFAQGSVERVYMNFPCPWPKTRHASRRVTVPSFAGLMEYVLAPQGKFELATDVDWYAEETAQVFSENSAFAAEPIEKNPARPYVTKYERKWKAMGKDTWHLVINKKAGVTTMAEKEEEWSTESTVESDKSVQDILSALRGREGSVAHNTVANGHWVFRETFISEENVGLVLVITADEGFEQHFYLKVIKNVRGTITIKVDSVGHPYRTPSMRHALLEALNYVR